MARSYYWYDTLTFGDKAAEDVAKALRAKGHMVIDLTKMADAQRRGVDFLVDNEHVDIKADRHSAVNVFLELECDGQPGCFYKSRADAWLYWFPGERLLYRLELPRLQHHVARNITRYREHTVTSGKGTDSWQAVGILVPLDELLSLGIAQDYSFIMKYEVSA